jgi:hypothetical protein
MGIVSALEHRSSHGGTLCRVAACCTVLQQARFSDRFIKLMMACWGTGEYSE